MNSVLFICIENSSRSQMAEAFAKRLGLDASSAGTIPSTHINPLVEDAMSEVGVDLSGHDTKGLDQGMIDHADLVVLTDASLEKSIPGNLRKRMKKKVVEWSVPDPQGKSMAEVRFIRDGIERKVEDLALDISAKRKR